MGRIFLTVEQAESVLPDGDSIHTFFNPGFGLIGADWSRENIRNRLLLANRIEICGDNAKRMGHGICAYNDADCLAKRTPVPYSADSLRHN